MDCLKFVLKHFLFIVNLIFTLLGLAIIAAGSFAYHFVTHNDVLSNVTSVADETFPENGLTTDILQYACIAIIVLGCVVFVISFCGCCGSIAENKCLLVSYALVMLVIAGASIYGFISRSGYVEKVERVVEENISEVFNRPTYPIEDTTINGIQHIVKCCGLSGPEFYKGSTINVDEHILDAVYEKLNITGVGLVSPSCCSTINLQAFIDDPQNYVLNTFHCTANDVYKDGCGPKILSYFDIVDKYLGIIFGVIAGISVLACLFGTYMCCAIQSNRDKLRYERY